MKKPPAPAPVPVVYFDNRDSMYWMKLDSGRYQHLSKHDLKLRMRYAGLEADLFAKGSDLTNFELVQCKAQQERWVDFAGPLAGHKCGPVDMGGGKRILVTSECELIGPKRGDCSRIEAFLGHLFAGTDGKRSEQLFYAMMWMKVAYESLASGNYKPGQLFAMAGKGGCGKSFMHILITKLLGGRSGKPYQFMTGKTNFNADLAGAEHLIMEDETARSNTGARREFGTAIKEWTVNYNIRVHDKGKMGIMMGFYRRLSLSVNLEPEYLVVLPPMDDSIRDKVMLFKVGNVDKNDVTVPPPLTNEKGNLAMLDKELPAFIHTLMKLEIPKSMRDTRFGVRAYHHPDLMEILSDQSDEQKLLEMIDHTFDTFEGTIQGVWKGSALKLQQHLESGDFAIQAGRIFRNASSCGTYLDRLATKHPARFESRKLHGKTVWIIQKSTNE